MANQTDKYLEWLDAEIAIAAAKVAGYSKSSYTASYLAHWQSRFYSLSEAKEVYEARLLTDNAPYPRASE